MKKYISMLLIFTLIFTIAGCAVDTDEIVDALENTAQEKANEFVDETVEGVKEGISSFWETYVTKPLNEAWDSLTGIFKHKITEKDGKYYSEDEQITDVTFDTIAEAKYRKEFSSCNQTQRKEVMISYLTYVDYDSTIINFIKQIDVKEFQENLEVFGTVEDVEAIEDAIILSSTDFALMELYAEAKNNSELAELLGNLGSGVEVAENVLNTVKLTFLIGDLANKDITQDAKEYCTEFVDVLSNITSNIPGVGGYYSSCLDVVHVGLEKLIAEYENYSVLYETMSITLSKNSGIFTGELEKISNPTQWKDASAPTLTKIKEYFDKHPDMLEKITTEEKAVIEKYIVWRLENKKD